MNSTLPRLALSAALGLACACSPAPRQDLATASVPADFTFKMSRSIAVSVASSSALLAPGKVARLTVARPDGKLLFEGGLGSGAEKSFRVGLPTKDESLVATLTLDDGQVIRAQIPVVADAAAVTFR